MFFNDRRKSNTRALKAANGPSLAPRNYKPDTEGRSDVRRDVAKGKGLAYDGKNRTRKQDYTLSAGRIDKGFGGLNNYTNRIGK
jgi:hypothetical protein